MGNLVADTRALVEATIESGGSFGDATKEVRAEFSLSLRDASFLTAKMVRVLAKDGHAGGLAMWERIKDSSFAQGLAP